MTAEQARKMRQKLKLNQSAFWGRVGMSQSAGSRIESGSRGVDKQTDLLLTMAYGSDKQAQATFNAMRGGA